jgi:hypothetical protein
MKTGSVGMTLLAGGCATGPAIHAAQPDLAQAIAAAGGAETGNMARAQKADLAKEAESITLLSIRPEDGLDPKAQEAARIWATVNGEAILAEEVRAAVQQQLYYTRNLPEPERRQKVEEILRAGLQQLVEREVVLQYAFTTLKSRGAAKVIDKLKEAAGKEFERTWVKGMTQNLKA